MPIWSDASTSAMWGTVSVSIGTLLFLVVGSMVVGISGFLVLGFAIKKVFTWITGYGFSDSERNARARQRWIKKQKEVPDWYD